MHSAGSKLTPEAFLAWEREQKEKHFYVAGEVFAMAGGSPRHNRLAAEITTRLTNALRGTECTTFTSDQRLGLPDEAFVYADAVVVCGPLVMRPGTNDVLTNPSIVVEVLSKSTEAYDRGDKQKAYLALESVEQYVLVSQREQRAEVYTRQQQGGGFHYDFVAPGGALRLAHGRVSIPIDDLFAGVFELPGD
jgi:Uma2 family endonuclease